MVVAIMQPYFFPYIGYFQLMHAVDLFVLYDDAQYMKGGWVNRNRIRVDGRSGWLTLATRRADVNLAINRRQYQLDGKNGVSKLERQLTHSYKKASCFEQLAPKILDLLAFHDCNVAAYNANLLVEIADLLDIGCRFEVSSRIHKTPGAKGPDVVIELCRHYGATHYVNMAGGAHLYSGAVFREAGLQLSFLHSTAAPVELADGPQQLSIVDGLLEVGVDANRARLPHYQLVSAP